MTDTKPRLTIEGEKDERPKGAAADAGAANGGASGKGGNPFSHAREATAAWLSGNFPGHENAFVGGACGLLAILLIYTIGLGKTLLIALFLVGGIAIGQIFDGDPKIIRAIRHLIEARNQ